MKKFFPSVIAISALVLSQTIFTSPAQAEELSAGDTSISWDESVFYYPVSCSSFNFQYSQSSEVLFSEITIKNKFGDNAGSSIIFGTNGTKSVQICSSYATPADAPFVIELESTQSGGGGSSIDSTSLTFVSRNQAAQNPTSSAPKIKVCVNKKTYKLKRLNSASCPAGTVLRKLK